MKLHWLLALVAITLIAADKAQDDAAKKDVQKLQGTWVMLSYEDDGKLDPQFKDAHQMFDGDKYEVKAGEKTLRKGSFVLDPTQKPAAIDLLPAIGPYKGKRLLGIYVLDGDNLKTCFGDPGKERPKKFESAAGTDQSQVVYKRSKS